MKIILRIEKFLQNKQAGILARWRVFYWRYHFANIPKNLTIFGKILIRRSENVFIGENVDLNEGVYITARDNVYIGDNSILSAYVKINTGGLRLVTVNGKRQEHFSAPVVIGKNVWLATGVIVNPGVTIGDGVVVGAGAVVSKDLSPYTLCVGVPAKSVKDISSL